MLTSNEVKDIEPRDWFAGQALAGILSNMPLPSQDSAEPIAQFATRVTASAYEIAEAMLKHSRKLKTASNRVGGTL
jgi:hypothetical protein